MIFYDVVDNPCEYPMPEHMLKAMELWTRGEILYPPGGFLYAIFTNNLKEAVMCADGTNIHLIPAYVSYMYNNAPSACWGSEDKVRAWYEHSKKVDEEMK